jgi:protein-disulfide isomerase
MKKYTSILLLVVFIVPSIAVASWWNPSSWSIFGFLHNKESSRQTQVVDSKNYEDKINELQKQIEELKSKNTTSSSTSVRIPISISDEVKAQVAKELKNQTAINALKNKDKTLSEKVGVSKESLTACMKAIDINTLNTKMTTSVDTAMSAVPVDQRGTPYMILVGSNGIKSEIKGALPIAELKKVIEEVKSGKVTSEYKGNVNVYEAGDHTLGNSNATVKVIEYSDLECPYCKIFHSTMKQVVADSNGSVSWTYRHWPIHQNSLEKLVAAECVAKLKGNDAFWKYVDLIFGMLNTGAPSITDQL